MGAEVTYDDRVGIDGGPERAPRPARRRRRRWRDALAVGLPMTVYTAHAAYYGPWIVDDAGITFAYARSIASGLGPVLQPGAAPVEGYSNPTWLALLVLARAVGLFDHGTLGGLPDIVVMPKVLGGLCCLGVFAAFHAVVRALGRPWWVTAILGTLCAAIPSFTIWTTSGLENGLYVLLVVGLGAVLARAALHGRLLEPRTALVCGLVVAGATLTRPDGAIHVVAYPLALLLTVRSGTWPASLRAAATSVLAAALPVGIYVAWRVATFGDWLPNTARAKSQGFPGPVDLAKASDLLDYAGWATSVVGVGVVAVVLTRPSRTRTAVGVLLVPWLLSVVAFAVLDWDWMAQARFATPVWALGVLTVGLATVEVLDRGDLRTRAVVATATVVALVLSSALWIGAATSFAAGPTAPLCLIARDGGENVNAVADALGVRSGSLLAVDAGGTSLVSRLQFVDLAGLTSRPIADLVERSDWAGMRDYLLDERKPTFIKPWRDHYGVGALLEDPRFLRDYEQVWSPKPYAGLWVRRDAITSPEALARAREVAPLMDDRTNADFAAPGARDRWLCPTVLSPPAPPG